MPGIARTGDVYGPGGVLTTPVSPNVLVNGRPVALNAVVYTAHPCCGELGCPPSHCYGIVPGVTALGFRVLVNGVPPVLLGDKGTCGHAIRTASENVQVGTGGKNVGEQGFSNPNLGTWRPQPGDLFGDGIGVA